MVRAPLWLSSSHVSAGCRQGGHGLRFGNAPAATPNRKAARMSCTAFRVLCSSALGAMSGGRSAPPLVDPHDLRLAIACWGKQKGRASPQARPFGCRETTHRVDRGGWHLGHLTPERWRMQGKRLVLISRWRRRKWPKTILTSR